MDKDTLLKLYWNFHPRFIFFKTLPMNANLLDVGAGSGGLFWWKTWCFPMRDDIKMYAVDLQKGQFFDYYDGWDIIDLEHKELPYDDLFFDAVMMNHVIEHLENPNNFLENLKRVTKDKGLIYVEYPGPISAKIPKKNTFGELCTISNFYDDASHINLYSQDKLRELFSSFGFSQIQGGENF